MAKKLTREAIVALGFSEADADRLVSAQENTGPKMIAMTFKATEERLIQLAQTNPDLIFSKRYLTREERAKRKEAKAAKKASGEGKKAKAKN